MARTGLAEPVRSWACHRAVDEGERGEEGEVEFEFSEMHVRGR